MDRTLILASTSRYRAELVQRLHLSVKCLPPDCDEQPLPGEPASQLVRRLAHGKAQSLAASHPDALIIGSDQVCDLGGQIIGKPGTVDRAVSQLERMSGKLAVFRTGLCLLDSLSGQAQIDEIQVHVQFRTLSLPEIERYVNADSPLDCAGSFRSEGLGISLLSALYGPDPTALIGLPLIRLASMLRETGVCVP